jgi:hypothetical protein
MIDFSKRLYSLLLSLASPNTFSLLCKWILATKLYAFSHLSLPCSLWSKTAHLASLIPPFHQTSAVIRFTTMGMRKSVVCESLAGFFFVDPPVTLNEMASARK